MSNEFDSSGIPFWEWAPKQQFQQEQAQKFQQSASQAVDQILAPPTPEAPTPWWTSTPFDNPLLSTDQQNEIAPSEPNPPGRPAGGGGALGAIGNIISGIHDNPVVNTLFGGSIEKPWDVLRPIARLQEYERSNVSRPLAQFAYEHVTGQDYNDLPGLVRMGLETITSPTSWIPGEDLVAGTARLAGALKVGEELPTAARLGIGLVAPGPIISPNTVMKLLGKNEINIVSSLPVLDKFFIGPGSEHAAQNVVMGIADSEGAKQEKADIVEPILDAKDKFDKGKDFAEVVSPEADKNGNEIDSAVKELLGWNDNPTERAALQRGSNPNIPDYQLPQDPITPQQEAYLRNLTDDQLREGIAHQESIFDQFKGRAEAEPDSQFPGVVSNAVKTSDAFSAELARRTSASADDIQTAMTNARGAPGTLQAALRSDDKAMRDIGKPPPAPDVSAQMQNFYDQGMKSIDMYEQSGKLSAAQDAAKRAELTRLYTESKTMPGIGGGAAAPTTAAQIAANLNLVPDTEVLAGDTQQIIDDARSKQSLSDLAQKAVRTILPDDLAQWFTKNGIRIYDTDVGPLISKWAEARAWAVNYGNSVSDQIEAAMRALEVDPQTERILSLPGSPRIDDLIRNMDNYQLTPEQISAIDTITNPIYHAVDIADATGVEGVPGKSTAAGRYVATTPKGEITVAPKYGSRQPITRSAGITDAEDALTNGTVLTPFALAQKAYVTQLIAAAADRALSKQIEPFGKTMSDLLPDSLKQQAALSADLKSQMDSLDRALQRAIDSRGRSFPLPTNVQHPALDPIVQAARDAINMPIAPGYTAARTAALRSAKMQLGGAITLATADSVKTKNLLAAAAAEVRRAGGAGDYTAGFHGRYFPGDVGLQLQQRLDTLPTDDILVKMNNVIRPVMTLGDASFASHAGLMGMFLNPLTYMRSLIQTFSSGQFENRIAEAASSGLLDQARAANLAWYARTDPGEFLLTGYLDKIPGATKVNTWFSRFGNVWRLNQFEDMMNTVAPGEGRLKLADALNLASGVGAHPATRFEQIAEFAPRYFRAQLGTISNGITRGDITGDFARQALRNMLVGGTAMTYAVNSALGEKTSFDPTDPNFLQMHIGDQKVSIFGQYESLVKAAQKLYSSGPIAATEYMARNKASPVVSHMLDILAGETYGGAPLDFSSVNSTLLSLWREGRANMPMSSFGAANELYNSPDIQGVQNAGLKFTGFRSIPENASDIRDSMSHEIYGKSWAELEPKDRAELQSTHPETVVIPTDKAFKARNALSQSFQQSQQRLDSQLPPGPDWRAAYDDLKKQESGAYGEWAREHPDAYNTLQTQTPRNPNEQAMQDYFKVFDDANSQGLTSSDIATRLQSLRESWTPDQQSYIDRNTGLSNSATVQAYHRDQKLLSPYWNIEDEVWSRLSQQPAFQQYPTLKSYIDAQAQQLTARGVPQDQAQSMVKQMPFVSRLEQTVTTLRERYRIVHPEVDKALALWYGTTPVARQAASTRTRAGL